MSAAPPEPERLASVDAALAHLRGGGLVAYPTETVWGLGADASNPAALARLRAWKGREGAKAGQPIAVLVPGGESAALDLPPAGRALAAAFWPGPLTLVARPRRPLAPAVAREDGAVGFRCSSHPVAAALAGAAEGAGLGPVTTTSLNRSGEPPARDRREAAALCAAGPDAPALLDLPGPDAGGGEPSSVVDVTGPEPRLLREGAIPGATLRARAEEKRCA